MVTIFRLQKLAVFRRVYTTLLKLVAVEFQVNICQHFLI